ncbi:MAG: hypothetical protein HKN06_12365 [Gammaproteobacteria bacterium]|nr:hypothetical protein [Gammaproteobacteria bacterium]
MMPWQMSYAATADLENSELQTDVMRFMAILAFCLVAIFAIVQSMPLSPEPVPASQAPEQRLPEPVVRVKQPLPRVVKAPEPVRETKTAAPAPVTRVVEPAPPVQRETARLVAARPLPVPQPVSQPAASRSEAPPAVPAATAAPARQGLSLQFESDTVLRSLVERGLVSLFAIEDAAFYQMAVTGGVVRFESAAAPAQYHQMVYDTVPSEVRGSFQAQHGHAARDMTWGVTLPAATTLQLRRFVQTNFQGSLVITAEGALALAGSS